MSVKRFNPGIIMVAGGVIVLVALVLILKFNSPPARAAVPSQIAPAQVAGAPATRPPATRAVVGPLTKPATAPATQQAAGRPDWTKLEWTALTNGTTVTQEDDVIHITGTTEVDDYNHWNGVKTDIVPEGDFTASVDFKVPAFTGPGVRLVYLRAGKNSSDAVGVYYQPGSSYRMQSWTPAAQAGGVRPFGDEATAFHKFTLQYDTAAQTATGWVDDKLVGRIKAPLTGAGSFWLVTNTQNKGVTMDVTFQNFKVVHGLKEATPVAATTSAVTRPATTLRDLP